jgi:hypothetical protein
LRWLLTGATLFQPFDPGKTLTFLVEHIINLCFFLVLLFFGISNTFASALVATVLRLAKPTLHRKYTRWRKVRHYGLRRKIQTRFLTRPTRRLLSVYIRSLQWSFMEPFLEDDSPLQIYKPHHPSSLQISEFVNSFNPASYFPIFKTLLDPNWFHSSSYTALQDQAMVAVLDVVDRRVDTTVKPLVYKALKTTELPIIIDSGASISLTPRLEDFHGTLKQCKLGHIQGIKSEIAVLGFGFVYWQVEDKYGVTRVIRTKAYYVPEAKIRLLSPQSYLQEHKRGRFLLEHTHTTLELADGSLLTFPYQASINLPVMHSTAAFGKTGLFHVGFDHADVVALGDSEITTLVSVCDERNDNLTSAQRELLLWHQKLVHADMSRIQQLCRQGILQTKNIAVKSCPRPLCAACQYGKQSRNNTGQQVRPDPERHNTLKAGQLRPGEMVSMDQFVSSYPGRLLTSRGKEGADDRYHGGTLMMDNASKFALFQPQVSLRFGETIQAKRKCEEFAYDCGTKIQFYHTDNSPFRGREFMEELHANNQKVRYSGVGGHHQNGVA